MPNPPSAIPDLQSKRLLVGVCGGVAAYKAALLVRLFKKAGAEVQVLMTADAARFITPLTLGTLSERKVHGEIFPENAAGSWTEHITLGLWADAFVIAPATAQTIAKLAHGMSDSMLTATALAARCPLVVCPAMDHDMYVHPATQRNLDRLRGYGYHVMDAAHGALASGLVGQGRLPEPEAIAAAVADVVRASAVPQTLAGRHVLVTAGPTREAIDPVRFLSNPSTGTMGFALAEAAARRGARVTLVAGPTALPTPPGVERVDIVSADALHAAVQARAEADVVIAAAAVADYAPEAPAPHKLKKSDNPDEGLTLRLRRTPDVLGALGQAKRPGQVLIGFALETQDGLANAQRKLERKNLDWIVLNSPVEPGAGFGAGTNRVTLIARDGPARELPPEPKRALAGTLLDAMFSEKVEGEG